MQNLASRFMALFDGAERGHGLYYIIGEKTPEGKRDGNGSTRAASVTEAMWEEHLAGKIRLGVIPIKEDSTVRFGAIDIDIYDGLDHRLLAANVEKNKLPLVTTRSKSGGAHMWCFSKEAVTAGSMQKKLKEISAFLGYGTAEIFPIQTKILAERGDRGNWINMPYQGGMRGMCFAVRPDGEAMDPVEFLDHCAKISVSAEDLAKPIPLKVLTTKDFADGPPCLQHLSGIGIPPGARNNGLFAIAVYLRKAFPEKWEDLLEDYNQKYVDPPLDREEVQGTLKSARKKEYAYPCSKNPIAQYCNSAVCKTRKFGITGDDAGREFPTLGQLTKLDVVPPLWFWDVDGRRLELSTTELLDPMLFQQKCVETINSVPIVPGKASWVKIVAHAMENVVVVEASEDSSTTGQFWEHFSKFSSGRSKAQAKDEIVLGKPFEEEGVVYFRLMDLEKFLDQQRFREFKTNKISSMLRDKGGEHHYEKFKGKGTHFWALPMGEKQTEKHAVPDSLKKGEEPY